MWRYGGDEDAVTLDKLDGSTWQKRRAEINIAVAETATSLVALAAERMEQTAPVLEPDSAAYEKLAAGFPFTETADQARAIDEVRADLASGKPMDRLVIGDVGYRQDRSRAARRGDRRAGGQAGRDRRADHRACAAACRDLRRTLRRGRDQGRGPQPPDERGRAEEDRRGACRRVDLDRDRHRRGRGQGGGVPRPRPGDHRRGTALRRRRQGQAARAVRRSLPGDERDPDPAHAAACADRAAAGVGHRDPAGAPPADPHGRRVVRCGNGAHGAAARERTRRAKLRRRPADRRHGGDGGRACESSCPSSSCSRRTASCPRPRSTTRWSASPRATATSCWRPTSSRPGSTCRAPTR